MRFFLVIFATALVSSSCQTGDSPAHAVSPPQSVEKLYVTKCAKCHELYDPKKYSDADWDYWMTKMRKKSKLKPDQFESIDSYLKTARGL